MDEIIYSHSLTKQIKVLIEGLFYPSESDEKLETIEFEKDFDFNIDESKLKKMIKAKPKDKVDISEFESFWHIISTPQDWWTDFEKDRMRKFLILKDWMQLNLTNLTYLRIGRVEIKAIIIGQDKDCNWTGIKTLIVET
jgi:hypothetical protein